MKQAKCSFSIDHILHKAGSSVNASSLNFDWTNCTRFRPPRIHRVRKKNQPGIGQRRNAGRNPRIPFSPRQVASLEDKFKQKHYLNSQDVHELAVKLQLSDTRVKIWFQNRRARFRRENFSSNRSSKIIGIEDERIKAPAAVGTEAHSYNISNGPFKITPHFHRSSSSPFDVNNITHPSKLSPTILNGKGKYFAHETCLRA